MIAITPDVAKAILLGHGRERDEARRSYLRSRDAEELLDWIGEATLAVAIKHPASGPLVVDTVTEVVAKVKAATG